MSRPPRDPREPLLGPRHWITLAGYAVLIAGAVFGALAWASQGLGMDARSVTVTF